MSKLSYEQMLWRIRIVGVVILAMLGTLLLVLFGCHVHGHCTVSHTTKSWDDLRRRVDEAYPAGGALFQESVETSNKRPWRGP